jgi:hypothetical protein
MDRKKFTRRGILKLLSAGGLAAWAGSVFPEFPLAKAAQSGSAPNAASGAMQSFVDLDDSHPLLVATMNTDGLKAIVAKHGRGALTSPGHAVYGDGSVQAVTMALKPSNSEAIRGVYGFFRTDHPSEIRVVQMELVVKNLQPFTGSLAFLDPSDRQVAKADYANGKMLSSAVHPDFQVPLPGIPVAQAYGGQDYWNCLSWCLSSIFPTLPWWLQGACWWALGACRRTFLPACGALIGCIGGYASACIIWCSCAPWCP